MKESPLQVRLNLFCQYVNQLETCHNKSYSDLNLIKQLIRSATSASLNYAEACVAASKRDFIHKARLSLKEIRESKENLSVLATSENIRIKNSALSLIGECGELNAILYKSVKTATENLQNGV